MSPSVPDFIPADEVESYLALVAKRTGKTLPTIIDAPGEYQTRGGLRVIIHEIKGPGSFSCKGTLYTPKRIKRGCSADFEIWQPNGKFRILDDHRSDVVRKVSA